MKTYRFILSFLLYCTSYLLQAQDVAIGEWKEHMSYKAAISVSEGDGKVYCATKSGVFFYDKSENTMERLTKVNGLSDVEPSVLNYNKTNKKLLIAYKNSNLDLIEGKYITNISDIKRKQIVGNKAINNIFYINQYAYLACGFGIVVIDMDKVEVKDTYYIGPNGSFINVYDITSDGSNLYAATSSGVYQASLSSTNLANFANWSKMSGLPTGVYNSIGYINGKLIVNYSSYLTTNVWHKDSVFVYENLSWSKFGPSGIIGTKKLKVDQDYFSIVIYGGVLLYDKNLNGLGSQFNYFSSNSDANAVTYDSDGVLWIADNNFGLVSYSASMGHSYRYPSGPKSHLLTNMNFYQDQLFIAPGGKGSFNTDGVYWKNKDEWKNIKGDYPGVVNLDTIFDIVNVLIDKTNPKRVYLASWADGVIELYNGTPIKLHNFKNSSLQLIPGTVDLLLVSGLALDEDGALWVNNNGVARSLSARHSNGSWKSFDFSPFIGSSPNVGQILIDKSNQKWVVLDRGAGLMVYKGGYNDVPNSTNTKKLTTASGNGALPSLSVYSLAEDKDGEIWVGTDKGVAVFYSPGNIFSGQSFDAQQILIEQDGHIQILLETEQVQAIAIDDANRKWIGTANSGVFLISADGTEQIHHFDINNSPLFSNNVKQIEINRESGEVFFGTEKGLISYRGTAIEGNEYFNDVYAFPNPVKPEYTGPIAIKGLVDNSTVKITDISGSLVYEMKSEGGQAIWNGKNFNGEKVSTGVYMVFCTNEDGSQKVATKILFIN